MNKIEQLSNVLDSAADYFESRGFLSWASEARHSSELIKSGNTLVIEELNLKYAPTCEVEELFITEYKIEDEDKVNILNQALSNVIKDTYWAIQHALDQNT